MLTPFETMLSVHWAIHFLGGNGSALRKLCFQPKNKESQRMR